MDHENITHTFSEKTKHYHFLLYNSRWKVSQSTERAKMVPKADPVNAHFYAQSPLGRREGAGLGGEARAGLRRAELQPVTDRTQACNGFPPIGLRGPFCACAAHFKLGRPLGTWCLWWSEPVGEGPRERVLVGWKLSCSCRRPLTRCLRFAV